ncbi:MAG: hypothetical protein KGL35_29225 [Bradyrhizobium sp.]|nr:hypothetical protein [Bradyrhizobium sp.]
MSSFSPLANTGSLSVGTSSTSAAIPLPGSATGWSHECQVSNTGTNAVFVAFGGSSVTAAIPVAGTPANGIPVPAGATVNFSLSGASHIAAIASTVTNAIYFTAGVGSA